MFLARIRKNGNSFVITVPPKELEAAGVSAGDLVDIRICPVEIRPVLRADLRQVFDEEFEQTRPALEYLAQRGD